MRWRARLSALGPTLTLFPAEFEFCLPSSAAGVVMRLLVPTLCRVRFVAEPDETERVRR